MTVADFAARLRNRETLIGYWVLLDAPPMTERLARLGYDYVAMDAQHGLFGYDGMLAGLTAIDAGGSSAGVIRVSSNDAGTIGRALDAGARAVIVPLINTAQDAAAAVAASRYAPAGIRSYGPMRSMLRIGPTPSEADASVAVLAMIETAEGLANVEAIAATPGVDGLYVGPSDLTLAIGGSTSTDPAVADAFEAALARVKRACEDNGIAAGLHTPSGEVAAKRISEGWTMLTVACDLVHLDIAARNHLSTARGDSGGRP